MISSTYKSGIADACAEIIKEVAAVKGRSLEEEFLDQAAKLSCSNFGDAAKGLFQYAAELAPTKEELATLPLKLDWRIRRRGRPVLTLKTWKQRTKGKQAGTWRLVRKKYSRGENKGKNIKAGEINRRIAARLFQATGWLSNGLDKYVKKGKLKRAGTVAFNLNGDVLSVTLHNPSKNAMEVNAANGNYIEKALQARATDMLLYLTNHMDKVSEKFRTKHFNG